MNSIPLIFNQHRIDMTVFGGREFTPDVKMDVSVIILNKSWSNYRVKMIENLMRCGFSQIVSIENDPENYNIDDFSHRFPFVKFIFPLEKTTDGELINIGMAEVTSEYVLVLRDSLDFSSDIISSSLASHLTESDFYCITPRLVSGGGISFPVMFSPSVHKGKLEIESSSIVSDGVHNLLPFDYIGLYNRKKFIDLGGFDYTLRESYWQNLDLAFRSWLWGEKTVFSTSFSMSYTEKCPQIDSTPSQYSNRFYLKNLVPRYNIDHGMIPPSSFFVFFRHSSCGLFEALSQFREAKNWVNENKYRYKRDVVDLVENWGK